MKPSASVENPNSFGSWPTMIVIGQAVEVADTHLAREQVGDEAQPGDAEADLDQPDEDGQHARRARWRWPGRRRRAAA